MKYLLILLLLPSCYGLKKARQQHGKAAATYPEIAADYCARVYPVRETVKSDTVTTFDTIYTGGETFFDTVVVRDVKYITKTVQLPGTHTIERQVIRDTVVRVNTAEADLWKINATNAISNEKAERSRADKWEKIAKQRFWIIAGMGAAMALGLFLFVRKKLIKR